MLDKALEAPARLALVEFVERQVLLDVQVGDEDQLQVPVVTRRDRRRVERQRHGQRRQRRRCAFLGAPLAPVLVVAVAVVTVAVA